jgi:hypothetical protein
VVTWSLKELRWVLGFLSKEQCIYGMPTSCSALMGVGVQFKPTPIPFKLKWFWNRLQQFIRDKFCHTCWRLRLLTFCTCGRYNYIFFIDKSNFWLAKYFTISSQDKKNSWLRRKEVLLQTLASIEETQIIVKLIQVVVLHTMSISLIFISSSHISMIVGCDVFSFTKSCDECYCN